MHNTSRSSLLYLTGDRGFRVDLPPGMRAPLQQWHIKVRLHGFLDDYTLRLRLPDLDDEDELEPEGGPGATAGADRSDGAGAAEAAAGISAREPRTSKGRQMRIVRIGRAAGVDRHAARMLFAAVI